MALMARMYGWTLPQIRALTPGEFQRFSRHAEKLLGMEMMLMAKITCLPYMTETHDREDVFRQIQSMIAGETVVQPELSLDALRADMRSHCGG